jgi:hypothetical protein
MLSTDQRCSHKTYNFFIVRATPLPDGWHLDVIKDGAVVEKVITL